MTELQERSGQEIGQEEEEEEEEEAEVKCTRIVSIAERAKEFTKLMKARSNKERASFPNNR